MKQIRKSTVEPVQVELLDGSTVLCRATAWIFFQHFKGFRAAETAALDQLDTMLEFIYDCVMDKAAVTKERFLHNVPFDATWIGEVFSALVSASSPERPTQEPAETKHSTGSPTNPPPVSTLD